MSSAGTRKPIKLAYLSGPVDAAEVYRQWASGAHTKLFGTSYLMQFYSLCAEIGAKAFVITTLPGSFTRQELGSVIIENRPPPKSRGLLYHVSIMWQMLALAPAIRKFEPSAFILTAHANYWFMFSYLKLLGTEIIPSAHCVMWRPFARTPVHWRVLLRLDGLFLRLFVRRAMAISQVVADQLKTLSGSNRLRVDVVTPTYRPGHFDTIPPPQHDCRPFRVLFHGRTEANKGIFDLVSIAARLDRDRPDQFFFDICGDGSDLERLRQTVIERGLAGIMHVHGFCDKGKMGELLASSHVVVVPTRSDFEEGLAKSCVEAVLASRPFISSPVCPAVKSLGDAAIEVPVDDVPAYHDAIAKLADDPVLYRQKVEACIPLQAQFYDCSQSYRAVLRRHLASSGTYRAKGHASKTDADMVAP